LDVDVEAGSVMKGSLNYRVSHGFGQVKFDSGGLSQFSLLPQLPQKRHLIQKWSKSTQK